MPKGTCISKSQNITRPPCCTPTAYMQVGREVGGKRTDVSPMKAEMKGEEKSVKTQNETGRKSVRTIESKQQKATNELKKRRVH